MTLMTDDEFYDFMSSSTGGPASTGWGLVGKAHHDYMKNLEPKIEKISSPQIEPYQLAHSATIQRTHRKPVTSFFWKLVKALSLFAVIAYLLS